LGRVWGAWVLVVGVCATLLLCCSVALAAGKPVIEAAWVEGVSASGATLRADIDPNERRTEYRFEYISDAAYEANPPANRFAGATQTPLNEDGPGPFPPVAASAQGLAKTTTYHYRPVASNEFGTTIGPEHVFTTEETGVSFQLPDGRAWELVSPVDKGGGAIAAPGALFGGGDIQAAAAGGALTYGSASAFADPEGAPPASQYISRRTGTGWVTENVSTPVESGAYGDQPDGAPYRLFSADLARGLLFGGLPCRGGLPGCPQPNPPLPGTGAPSGYMAYYLRDSASGTLASLLDEADFDETGVSPESLVLKFAAASPDLAHIALSTCAALTANAVEVPDGPGRCDADAANLFVWSAGGLKAVNLLPAQPQTSPRAEIAAPLGAISNDGTRVYWTLGGDLYLRDGVQTHQVDIAQGGGGGFQTATPDGSVAFFTAAGHLYRFLATSQVATDLTPSGGVQGVLGASADGTYVYYQDGAGLKVWNNGTTAMVASGAQAAAPSDYPPATGTARVTPDGRHLAFLSLVPLPTPGDPGGYDNTDSKTFQPDAELYVYGPPIGGGAPELQCASCNPTGERPQGPASIPGVLVNGSTLAYEPRSLSANGSRLFFDSRDDLNDKDVNSAPDVYQWERAGSGTCQRQPGCVRLISSGGESAGGASFLDASLDGGDVYFLTNESLVRADPGSIDVYDARVGGGIPEPLQPLPCVGDACQSLPGAPDDPTPATVVPNAGNPKLRIFKPRRERKAKPNRGKLRGKGKQKGKGKRGGRRHGGKAR
jgi:hypothetical protein